MIQKELEKFGLEPKEALIYIACLELGEASVQQIARKSGVKRTTVYTIVESIKAKGLISTVSKNKKLLYHAEDPRLLERKLDEQQQSLRRLLPELLSITNSIKQKPRLRFFEGAEGIKEVYKDTISIPNEDIVAWGSEKAVENFDADFLNNYYVPTRVKKNIFVRAIASDNEVWRTYKKTDRQSLRELRLTTSPKSNLAVEIDLYGSNKTAIISFEEQIALIIESEKIHTTLKSIFEMAWEGFGKNESVL